MRSNTRLERVHIDFSNVLAEMHRKTRIPKTELSKDIAQQLKKLNGDSLVIDLYPFRHKALLTRIK